MRSSAPARVSLFLALCAAVALYGVACATSSPGNTPDGGVVPEGGDCTGNFDCQSGHCVNSLENEPAACRTQCRPDGTCSTNQACTLVTEGSGERVRLCLPLVETRSAGNACEGSRQCSSGVCAELGGPAANGVCVEPCPADETCPVNTECMVDHRLASRAFCTPPLADLADGESCSSGRECAGGRCVPWGGRMRCAPSCLNCALDAGVCGPFEEDAEDYGAACLPLLATGDYCLRSSECASTTCFAAVPVGIDAGVLGTCVGPCGPDSLCPSLTGCVPLTGIDGRSCVPLTDTRAPGEGCLLYTSDAADE